LYVYDLIVSVITLECWIHVYELSVSMTQ